MIRRILLPTVLALLLSAAVQLPAAAPALAAQWGEIRYADRNLNIRAGRSADASHVRTLMKGDRVRVDFLEDGWFAVFDLDQAERDESKAVGYSKAKYLLPVTEEATKAEGRAQKEAVKAMDNSKSPAAQDPAPTANTAQSAPTSNGAGSPSTQETAPSAITAPVASAPAPQPVPEGERVHITADRMTYNEAKGTVAFTGNVVALHNGLNLRSSKLSAYLSERKAGANADRIDHIVATGDVKMHNERGTTGTCGKLTYYVQTGILTMEQDPIITDGPNRIQGEVIKFYVKDNRSEVLGGKSGRVEAEFTTKGLKGN